MEPFDSARQWASNQHHWDDPNSLREGYHALIRLFDDYVVVDQYDTVLAGALAIYGWMPTMLATLDRDTWCHHARAIACVRAAPDWPTLRNIIANNNELLSVINGSLVGTSKFYHFLNPKVVPIWDSRVALCFGHRWSYSANRVESFIEYGNVLHDEIALSSPIPLSFADFVGNTSSVRMFEALLFYYGGHLRSQIRASD